MAGGTASLARLAALTWVRKRAATARLKARVPGEDDVTGRKPMASALQRLRRRPIPEARSHAVEALLLETAASSKRARPLQASLLLATGGHSHMRNDVRDPPGKVGRQPRKTLGVFAKRDPPGGFVSTTPSPSRSRTSTTHPTKTRNDGANLIHRTSPSANVIERKPRVSVSSDTSCNAVSRWLRSNCTDATTRRTVGSRNTSADFWTCLSRSPRPDSSYPRPDP